MINYLLKFFSKYTIELFNKEANSLYNDSLDLIDEEISPDNEELNIKIKAYLLIDKPSQEENEAFAQSIQEVYFYIQKELDYKQAICDLLDKAYILPTDEKYGALNTLTRINYEFNHYFSEMTNRLIQLNAEQIAEYKKTLKETNPFYVINKETNYGDN